MSPTSLGATEMTPQITFKENSRYLLEQGIFNRAILTCHCVQDGYAYFSTNLSSESLSQAYTEKVEYKYNIKKERMYVFNKAMQTWDSVDNYTIAEYGPAQPESTHYDYSKVRT